MRLNSLLLFILSIFAVQSVVAQHRKTTKDTKKDVQRDFVEIKVPQKLWMPSDTSLLKGKLMPLMNIGNMDAFEDSLAIGDGDEPGGEGDTEIVGGVGGSKIITDYSTRAFDQRAKSSKRLKRPAPLSQDTLAIKNLLLSSTEGVSDVDLNVRKSMVREDTTSLYDVSLEDMVIVSEELAIDCVWVTLTNYYAVWDSENINPYKADVDDWKEPIPIVLYDSTKDFTWSPPLASLKVTSGFGYRWHRWHHGVDLDLETGDSVFAAFDGIVRVAKYDRGGYGNFIVIRHYNGLETLYGHLSKSYVQVGDYLRAGEVLGEGGSTGRSTGPHLHYEVRYNGYAFDPRVIYDFDNQKIITNLFALTPEHFKHLSSHRQTIYHRVRYGDSLSRIASRYRTSVSALCRLNGMSTRSKLRPGQRVRVR